MGKVITINKCTQCPYLGHRGGFGQISYIPSCGKRAGRELPYTKGVSGSMVIATPTGEIPDWCPLQDHYDLAKD